MMIVSQLKLGEEEVKMKNKKKDLGLDNSKHNKQLIIQKESEDLKKSHYKKEKSYSKEVTLIFSIFSIFDNK